MPPGGRYANLCPGGNSLARKTIWYVTLSGENRGRASGFLGAWAGKGFWWAAKKRFFLTDTWEGGHSSKEYLVSISDWGGL